MERLPSRVWVARVGYMVLLLEAVSGCSLFLPDPPRGDDEITNLNRPDASVAAETQRSETASGSNLDSDVVESVASSTSRDAASLSSFDAASSSSLGPVPAHISDAPDPAGEASAETLDASGRAETGPDAGGRQDEHSDDAGSCDDAAACVGEQMCELGCCTCGPSSECSNEGDCPAPAGECVRAKCNAGHCETRPLTKGEPCGSRRDDSCDAADSCDGRGQCLENLATVTTICDDGLFCTTGDHCDGAGGCEGSASDACGLNENCDESANKCVCQTECCSNGDCGVDQACTVDGSCVCASGYKSCGDACIPNSQCCGACREPADVCQVAACLSDGTCGSRPAPDDTACGTNRACSGGTCECAAGFTSCNGQCVATSSITFYQDNDNDSFGDPERPLERCGGTPDGYVANSSDCCDLDGNARPTQTSGFSRQTQCGGYDYNCDGEAQFILPGVSMLDGGQGWCSRTEGWVNGVPNCGAIGQYTSGGAGQQCPSSGEMVQTCR